jgi:hypothetical protein
MNGPRSIVLALGALLAPVPAAFAGDPPPPAPAENVADDKAKSAIESFKREFKGEDIDLRLEAVARLRKVVHPDVATLLWDLAFKEKDVNVRAAAFKGLAYQKTSAKTLGPKLARFLSDAAEENRKAKARGHYGFVIDKKTGEPDLESPEGKEALRVKRERGKMMAEAVRALDLLEYRESDSVEALREFLSDGNDDVVALALGMLGRWKEWPVLPDCLELFEMYPNETECNTGSVSVDTGAAGSEDAQAAKRKWMAKYGDPDRRRARPKVVKALKKCLLDITGEEFEEPKALREYMRRPDVKRKVKGR